MQKRRKIKQRCWIVISRKPIVNYGRFLLCCLTRGQAQTLALSIEKCLSCKQGVSKNSIQIVPIEGLVFKEQLLLVEVWTDGTLLAQDALNQSYLESVLALTKLAYPPEEGQELFEEVPYQEDYLPFMLCKPMLFKDIVQNPGEKFSESWENMLKEEKRKYNQNNNMRFFHLRCFKNHQAEILGLVLQKALLGEISETSPASLKSIKVVNVDIETRSSHMYRASLGGEMLTLQICTDKKVSPKQLLSEVCSSFQSLLNPILDPEKISKEEHILSNSDKTLNLVRFLEPEPEEDPVDQNIFLESEDPSIDFLFILQNMLLNLPFESVRDHWGKEEREFYRELYERTFLYMDLISQNKEILKEFPIDWDSLVVNQLKFYDEQFWDENFWDFKRYTTSFLLEVYKRRRKGFAFISYHIDTFLLLDLFLTILRMILE